jgi:hypothetical protein
METIDFLNIRSLSAGQRYSFEELVCQLARREPAAAGSTFRRVEGTGGDGGVEGYWLLPDGSKHGYQAKYFTRSRDIDWTQFDSSVREALKNHPTLTRYVIAVPCDLTDRSGAIGKGRTGWHHWEAHQTKWHAWSRRLRSNVEFVPWTASDLRDLLIKPSAHGLRRYWFGKEEFSAEWFACNVGSAVAALDERYHPEDHVDVSIEQLFGFVCRSDVAVKRLKDGVEKIERIEIPAAYLETIDDKAPLTYLIAAAYGACCIDPSPERLKSYASVVFKSVFKTPPPRSILLRDYARGIVELCDKTTTLPTIINLKKCRPPYRSPLPNLRVTEARVTRISSMPS